MRSAWICIVLAAAPSGAFADAAGSSLGKAEAKCRPNEVGPAVLVNIVGLKDRNGFLKLEIYPSKEGEFLGDDSQLISAGKAFRRVEVDVPTTGDVQLCARLPIAGAYSLTVLHDRNSNHKWDKLADGIGFASNPKLHLRAPTAAETRFNANGGVTTINVVMNYWLGLLSYGPLKRH